MNLIQKIRDLLVRPVWKGPALEAVTPVSQGPAAPYNDHGVKAGEPEAVQVAADALLEKFEMDFNTIFYQPGLEAFIQEQLIPLLYPKWGGYNFFGDHWESKNPLNFPGPFYTVETDTCCTGPCEAPHNVLCDFSSNEFIFRQPANFTELLQVLSAAVIEVYCGYACNGNRYWTLQRCRDWWKTRPQIIAELSAPPMIKAAGAPILAYVDYLRGDAETDLRRYCYFLENGSYPSKDGLQLPSL